MQDLTPVSWSTGVEYAAKGATFRSSSAPAAGRRPPVRSWRVPGKPANQRSRSP